MSKQFFFIKNYINTFLFKYFVELLMNLTQISLQRQVKKLHIFFFFTILLYTCALSLKTIIIDVIY